MNTSAGPPSTTLLTKLRLATADQHRDLDGALNITSPAFDRWAYRQLLQGFYGLHAAWEPRAASRFGAVMPGFYDRRCRLHLIEQDLIALGLNREEIAAIPVCHALADHPTLSSVLGAAYVLEGSTLGGQILSRQFARSLGVGPESGGAYFYGYGEKTGEMWREFSRMMESYAALTVIQEEVVEGARRAFTIVHKWLLERDE